MAGYSSGPRLLPSCIQEKSSGDVGPSTDYPIGFTKEQWFEIYFRVKDWTFQIDWSLSASVTAGSASASGSISGPGIGDSTSGLSSEKSFACLNNASYGSIPNDSDYDPVTNPDAYAYSDIWTSFAGPTLGLHESPCYMVGSLYYPKVMMNFTIRAICYGGWEDGFPGYDEEVYHLHEWHDPSAPYLTPYNIPLEIAGVSGIWQGTKFSANTGDGEGSATASANITSIKMTPKSYWPYDPGDGGGPVWDAETGAQLRDPLSV